MGYRVLPGVKGTQFSNPGKDRPPRATQGGPPGPCWYCPLHAPGQAPVQPGL